MSRPLEHDYIGLSEISSMEENSVNNNITSKPTTFSCNALKTELSLGLPGSESPERKHVCGVTIFGKDFEEKSVKGCASGAKRGFSDANLSKDGCLLYSSSLRGGPSGKNLSGVDNNHPCSSPKPVLNQQPQVSAANEHASAPAAKAQVVGWPPIRSFRKNTLASAKNNEQTEEKSAAPCLYVKVSMDGAPYLRKVDLQTYGNYKELSSALEKMFNCTITGQTGSNGHGKQDGLGESQSTDIQNAENVLTYEDKDGDWMLVGDVPWRMFTENCRKLRIMKGSEAIGLAPNAAEKCKTEV